MIGLLWEIFNLLKEVLNRTAKAPELLLTLAGLRTTKKLLLRVVVLRDERGLPLASNEEVLPAYEAVSYTHLMLILMMFVCNVILAEAIY